MEAALERNKAEVYKRVDMVIDAAAAKSGMR
jgi:hypothetical protein